MQPNIVHSLTCTFEIPYASCLMCAAHEACGTTRAQLRHVTSQLKRMNQMWCAYKCDVTCVCDMTRTCDMSRVCDVCDVTRMCHECDVTRMCHVCDVTGMCDVCDVTGMRDMIRIFDITSLCAMCDTSVSDFCA